MDRAAKGDGWGLYGEPPGAFDATTEVCINKSVDKYIDRDRLIDR